MAKRTVDESSLTAVADAIRDRAGTSEPLVFPDGFVGAVEGIPNDTQPVIDSFLKRTVTSVYSEISTAANYFLQYCTELETVNMPNLEFTHAWGFGNCSKLVDVSLPNTWKVSNGGFENCTSLKFLDLPKLTAIGSSAFKGCTVLDTLVFRMNQVVSLENVNSFTSTPFASGGTGGTVYVPASLISAYQSATNWSTLYAAGTCNFVAIEGSEYE